MADEDTQPAVESAAQGDSGTKTDSNTQKEIFSIDEAAAQSDIASEGSGKNESYYEQIENIFGDTVIDITTDYDWSLNRKKSMEGKFGGLPFLYAIEYKQKYGVTATNLKNTLMAIANAGGGIAGVSMEGVFKRVGNYLGHALTQLAGKAKAEGYEFVEKGLQKTLQVGKDIKNTIGDLSTSFNDKSGLLSPYKHLYALEKTNVKFCFPYFGENAASFSLTNDFSAEGNKSLLTKLLMVDAASDIANGVAHIAADINDIKTAFGGTGGFVMYNIEKAKAFNFPSTGKTVSLRFPLFNTITKDSWKKNYKFIAGFALRNMLFRKDNVAYYPPMFYDVSIPGWGRMPLSYVKQFVAKPVGMIRPLSYDDKLFGSKNLTINVPEAWIVQIDFISLIADSANQFLSSIIDLPISAQVVESSVN